MELKLCSSTMSREAVEKHNLYSWNIVEKLTLCPARNIKFFMLYLCRNVKIFCHDVPRLWYSWKIVELCVTNNNFQEIFPDSRINPYKPQRGVPPPSFGWKSGHLWPARLEPLQTTGDTAPLPTPHQEGREGLRGQLLPRSGGTATPRKL